MGLGLIRQAIALLAAIWALTAMPAMANHFQPGSKCHAFLASGEDLNTVEQQHSRWNCENTGWRVENGRAIIRLDLRGLAETPRYFITRLSDFDRLTLHAMGVGGATQSLSFTPDKMHAAQSIYEMYAPLPQFPPGARSVIVDIKGPRYAGVVTEVELSPVAPVGRSGPLETLVVLLCGLLLAPVLFDIAFHRVLRERFPLWHGLMGLSVLTYVAVTGGIAARFIPLTAHMVRSLTEWSLAVGFAAAAMFFAAYVEPGKLDRRHRSILHLIAAGGLLLAVLERSDLLPAALVQQAFYLGWAPIILIYGWLMSSGLKRGSRAAKFQAIAWTPLILVGAFQVAGNLGLTSVATSNFVPFYLAMTFEMIVTAFGVADRFMIIKRERDRALTEARILGQLADRDPLTGLLNRRAVETRFEEFLAAGFSTVALVDLDHFKRINDTRGHAIGDTVLKSVAEALAPDEDSISVRLGGEEFMLLLRGDGAAQKAERMRSAIPQRIAADVPGLEGLVTASMGMVEFPKDGRIRCSFASLYAQCDRLLYEAKNAGRNRMLQERMQFFGKDELRAAA